MRIPHPAEEHDVFRNSFWDSFWNEAPADTPLSYVYALLTRHGGEHRHWAYKTVFWTEWPGMSPRIGGAFPRQFRIDPHSPKTARHCCLPWPGEERRNGQRDGQWRRPDLNNAETTILANSTLGHTHWRAMHLVLGLAELFEKYACDATTTDIYCTVLS